MGLEVNTRDPRVVSGKENGRRRSRRSRAESTHLFDEDRIVGSVRGELLEPILSEPSASSRPGVALNANASETVEVSIGVTESFELPSE